MEVHLTEPDAQASFPPALELAALLEAITRRRARLVAIDGCGGSGKSTLARRLAEALPRAVVVEMDDFHRPSAQCVDRPAAPGGNYDRQRLVAEVLAPLKARHAGRYRRYDWSEDHLAEWHEVPADSLVLIEGVYSTSALLRSYLDYTIWVGCPYAIRLRRGIERDGEAMRPEWVDHWMPAEDRYIAAEQPEERVDAVFDGSGIGAAGADAPGSPRQRRSR